ncbi:Malonyl CoA-acyl carrier protein transacylase [Modicisalibacter ilicicola DSM 19980]|uniref:[acyl-carrier-protein] S-malonyltransferase n=1 Tax=Modicisalibacter ilicicola DSM 19980 TaxID=1121942 RepID=A0A1M4WGN6_9GAMM|nr:acyl carrier protein [Halomonas ilicicola]SHE80408.1 Malonyl CoA-acyl carrier protein transacylase [Halomonas ilicicola DSM 19980]
MSELTHASRRERLVIVCPGRGTYNQAEWGTLTRHAAGSAWLSRFDALRREQGQPTLSELDGETPFRMSLHGRGDHASPLIYACALADVLAIDPARYEICAVTGNSMGWYIALAVGGALPKDAAFTLINTMGHLMQTTLNGGQVIYPWVDDQWRPQPERRRELLALIETLHGQDGSELYLSIDLGGMLVFGGNEAGLKRLIEELPPLERFPLRLHQHAAFHTPLQEGVKAEARTRLPATSFGAPRLPLIDGRGKLWTPWSTDPEALWDYTLGEQLVTPYDFTTALNVSVREFAPDRIVIPGPGSTLGGAVAQALIQLGWQGLDSKAAFQAMQQSEPRLISMGIEEQRRWLVDEE